MRVRKNERKKERIVKLEYQIPTLTLLAPHMFVSRSATRVKIVNEVSECGRSLNLHLLVLPYHCTFRQPRKLLCFFFFHSEGATCENLLFTNEQKNGRKW